MNTFVNVLSIVRNFVSMLWPKGRAADFEPTSIAAATNPELRRRSKSSRRKVAATMDDMCGWLDSRELLDNIEHVYAALNMDRIKDLQCFKMLDEVGAVLVHASQIAAAREDNRGVLDWFSVDALPANIIVAWPKPLTSGSPGIFQFVKVKAPPVGFFPVKNAAAYYKVALIMEGIKSGRTTGTGKLQGWARYAAVTLDGLACPCPQAFPFHSSVVARMKNGKTKRREWTSTRIAYDVPTPLNDTTWTEFFSSIMRAVAMRDASIQVRFTKNRKALVVPIGFDSAKTFFKERIPVRSKAGRSSPIFHFVTAHSRKNGSNVRMHFKGLRSFVWNGFGVQINIPGKHARMISAFDVAGVEYDFEPPGSDYITEDQLAEQIKAATA